MVPVLIIAKYLDMAFGVVFSDSLVLEGPKVEKAFSIPLAKKRLLLIEENSVSILL